MFFQLTAIQIPNRRLIGFLAWEQSLQNGKMVVALWATHFIPGKTIYINFDVYSEGSQTPEIKIVKRLFLER